MFLSCRNTSSHILKEITFHNVLNGNKLKEITDPVPVAVLDDGDGVALALDGVGLQLLISSLPRSSVTIPAMAALLGAAILA